MLVQEKILYHQNFTVSILFLECETMSYQIITDSCCDLPESLRDSLSITVLPLTVEFQGQVLDDKNDDSLKQLYDYFRAGQSAKTSAVNPTRWASAMEAVLDQGEDVLTLAFSSGLSTTYQSAVIAAEELKERYPERRILVIDTLSASMGQGLLVYLACQKRDEGMGLEELAAWVEDTKPHLCHWFTVDDLMYLKRGGRISASAAVMGSVLQIKPVLHMDADGHLINMLKARGRKASLRSLAEKLKELGEGYDNRTVFLSHGDCAEDAAYLETLLKEQYGVQQVVTGYVGAVIGSHSGPGTVARFFLGSHR